jgi:hypothetical protein
MRNRLILLLAGIGLVAISGIASAHDNVRLSIGFNVPAYPVTYVRPAPVTYVSGPIYSQAPVVYYPPTTTVYYGPQVRYVPAPVRVEYVNGRYGWPRQHWHDHRDHW